MKRDQTAKTVRFFVRSNDKTKLDLRPGFQRTFVWSKTQQQMLVDSILKDMDIPKIYLREVSGGDYEYEVVDGQQRLQSVINFCNNEFKTEPTEINGIKIGEVLYDNLDDIDDDLREQIDSYEFSVVVLRDTTKEEVEEMFLRLQGGTSLNAQEKRNAKSGKMRDFIKELAKHDFFAKCDFKNHRYAHELIAAQMMLLELAGNIRNIKNSDLNKMYEEKKDFDNKSDVAKEIRKTLSCLSRVFLEKTPEVKRHNAISMFLLLRYLRKNYFITGREKEIGEWFIDFENSRLDDMAKKSTDEVDGGMIVYQEKTSHSTDAAESLEYRQTFLRVRLMSAIPDLILLDPKRSFTDEQRRSIWRRDNGICQIADKCDGKRFGFDENWHADHKVPWAGGGKTSVENGQVACAECNLAKGGAKNN